MQPSAKPSMAPRLPARCRKCRRGCESLLIVAPFSAPVDADGHSNIIVSTERNVSSISRSTIMDRLVRSQSHSRR